MTIYFQGSELEALWPNPATPGATEDSRYDPLWSRRGAQPASGGTAYLLADAGQELESAWFHWYWKQTTASSPQQGNRPVLITGTDSLVQIVRIYFTLEGWAQLQYYDGSGWVGVGESFRSDGGTEENVDLFVSHAAGAHKLEFYIKELLVAEKSGGEFLQGTGSQKFFMNGQNARALAYSQVQIADEETINWHALTVAPATNGTDTDGVGPVGNVNEAVINNATYIAFDSVGQHRSFKSAARTLSTTVKGVTIAGRLRRADDAAPDKVKPYLLIAGIRYYGTTFDLTLGYLNFQYTWNLNPATAAPWSPLEANSADLEFGWEIVGGVE